MKSYSVFLVSHKNLDSIKLIDAAFDSIDKAEAYANRYKTHQEPDWEFQQKYTAVLPLN